MRAVYVGAVSLCLLAVATGGQELITVGPAVQVLRTPGTTAQGEGMIAADPTNARLLTCLMEVGQEAQYHRIAVSLSEDNGSTWRQTFASEWDEEAADPACAYGPDGRAYVIVAPRTRPAGRTMHRMYLRRSDDGGRTWVTGAGLPLLDAQSVVIDATTGRFRGRIYVHGLANTSTSEGVRRSNVTLFSSSDGGATFVGPVTRMVMGHRQIFPMGTSLVLRDGTWLGAYGEVREFWQNLTDNEGGGKILPASDRFPNADIKVVASTDGGETLGVSSTVTDWHLPIASMLKGVTAGRPTLATDMSDGPFGGRVYVVWPDARRQHVDVFFSYSTDQGRSWSRPIVVNDAWRDEAGEFRDHFMPTVAVNANGTIGVAWYDRRQEADNLGWTLRFAASLDGGQTFLPSAAVRGVTTHFDERAKELAAGVAVPASGGRAARLDVILSNFFYMGGDYAGMAASGDGTFYPYGIGNRGGLHRAFTAAIRVNAVPCRFGFPDLESMTDIGSLVTLQVAHTEYDTRAHTVDVTVRLRNVSTAVVNRPLLLRIAGPRSELGDPSPANADRSSPSGGAVWDFSDVLPGSGLKPGEVTEPKSLRFSIRNPRPRYRNGRPHFGLVSFETALLSPRSKGGP